ncbi:MAG: hypothetical protein HC783_16705 [Rhodobacteraceae bacterium]|nr:hypothetical protein [Paracoccaceae bacterium]
MTDLPPPLSLQVTTSPHLLQRVADVIVSREMGAARRILVLVGPLIGAMILASSIGWLVGVSLFEAALVGSYGFIGAAIGFVLVRRSLGRRTMSIQATSALRQRAAGIELGPEGVTLAARTLPWADVSQLARWKDCTLVHFSAADALVIPDAALPPGTSPEALATRIAAWKAPG